MPLLRITCDDQGPRLHGTAALIPALRHGLAADPGPVTVMIHGFRYAPGHMISCPHRSLLAAGPVSSARIRSWPRRLGLRGQHGEGLGLAFGWNARGTIWQAHARAAHAGRGLAALVDLIHRIDPARPVNVVAHSLGARVALRALALDAPVSRMVLLAGAEFASTTRAALRTQAGQQAQVLNVTSRENDLFDFAMECLVRPPEAGDRMLGHGQLALPNVATLQLDHTETLARLRKAGFPIAEPTRRVCHWSPYLRAGVFPLYRAVLSGSLSLPHLRALLPDEPSPRWSRLLPPRPRAPLPALPAR